MSNKMSASLFIESNLNEQNWNLTTSTIPLNSETLVHLIVNGTFVQVYFNGSPAGSTTTISLFSSNRPTQLYLGYGSSFKEISIGSLFISKVENAISLSTYLNASTRYSGSAINTFGFTSSIIDKFISINRAISPVTSMSESQLTSFLNFNLGIQSNLNKRQFLSVATDISLTSYYLSLCQLNSISANVTGNSLILAGCLSGVTQTCQSGDIEKCRGYWTSVYENSVFKPIKLCLPWNSGSISEACNSAVTAYCASPKTSLYQCIFAKTSQKTLFTNSIYTAYTRSPSGY